MEEEVWKPIKDYEGLYEVSNMGRVKNLNYKGSGKEKILKNIVILLERLNLKMLLSIIILLIFILPLQLQKHKA